MANFDEAIKHLLPLEGGYSNNPKDPGGPTDFGISLKFIKDAQIDINSDGKINIEDIMALNPQKASDIYKKEWWDRYGYGKLNSQLIANKLFDLSVNAGPYQSHVIAQRANNQVKIRNSIWVDADGVMGVNTVSALNNLTTYGKEGSLLQAIKDNAILFYVKLVLNNSSLDGFLLGWVRRAVA